MHRYTSRSFKSFKYINIIIGFRRIFRRTGIAVSVFGPSENYSYNLKIITHSKKYFECLWWNSNLIKTREAQKQARIDKEQAKVAAEKEAKEAKEAAELQKKEQEAEKKADILSGKYFVKMLIWNRHCYTRNRSFRVGFDFWFSTSNVIHDNKGSFYGNGRSIYERSIYDRLLLDRPFRWQIFTKY